RLARLQREPLDGPGRHRDGGARGHHPGRLPLLLHRVLLGAAHGNDRLAAGGATLTMKPLHDIRRTDYVAGATLVVVAILALLASLSLPWWTMRARAPQYGQRVLVIEVSPRAVKGDVFEVDTLGHYVGIRPMARLGRV